MIEIVKTILLALAPPVVFGVLCIVVELALPRDRYALRARFPGFFWLVLAPLLVSLATLPITRAWRGMGLPPWIDLTTHGLIVDTLILLLIFDFLRYCEHRLEHALWWPVHGVHHSATELHVANAYSHPLEGVPQAIFVLIPFGLFAADRPAMLLVMAISGFQNYAIHAPVRLHFGPLRRVFVDSRFHRIHHSQEERHHDRNFGFIFTIWDQLFGTAYFPGESEWPDTGTPGFAPPKTFGGYLLHPLQHFRRERSYRI
jgi:sterol desaturase/sphingolipid hydroxylase (fatty acid hydroxylase superfamily)